MKKESVTTKFRTGTAPWVYKMELQVPHSVCAEVELEVIFSSGRRFSKKNAWKSEKY